LLPVDRSRRGVFFQIASLSLAKKRKRRQNETIDHERKLTRRAIVVVIDGQATETKLKKSETQPHRLVLTRRLKNEMLLSR